MANLVCKKVYRSNPLTKLEKLFNREKSRVRSRVEHIFGWMEGSMNGMLLQNRGKSCTFAGFALAIGQF